MGPEGGGRETFRDADGAPGYAAGACGARTNPLSQPAGRGRRDKAYASRGNRAHLRKRPIKAVIPEKRDQAANWKQKGSKGGRPVSHDADLYKERNTVERTINRLRAWRGIATRYDKTPGSYLAGLHFRASTIWIRDLIGPTP